MIDINIFIIIIVFSTCLGTIIKVFQGIIPKDDGWIIISLFISLITGFLLVISAGLSAWIGGILLTSFLLIPQWGFLRVNRLFGIKDYQKSRQLLSKLMFLHYTQYWRNFYQLLWALELGNNGDTQKAITLLNIKNNHLPIFHYYYKLFAYEILGDWESCLQWFNHQIDKQILFSDSLLLTYYIRTLGETGNLNGLFQNILTVQSILIKQKKYSYISRIKLYAFAFSGQISAIKNLFESELSFYPKHLQVFWLVTARTVIDQNNDNYRILISKYLSDHYLLRSSLEWRLNQTSIPFLDKIKNSNYNHLHKLSLTKKKSNYNLNILRFKNNPITLLLIVLNSLVFTTQISFGGSENFEALYQLGALVPMIVWQGEFWRILTANFLHYGWGHFTMNMLALYFIGNLVEFLSNKYHYMMIYLVSGVGSMFAFSSLAVYINDVDYILVGASASIMGLVGSLTAIFLRRWLWDKSSLNLKRLLMMVMVITLQLISDYLIPQVSLLSHLFGLLIGFMLESLTGLLTTQKT